MTNQVKKKSLKENIKRNKGIILGTGAIIIIGGLTYSLYRKDIACSKLLEKVNVSDKRFEDIEHDVKLITSVVSGNVLGTLRKNALKRISGLENKKQYMINNKTIKDISDTVIKGIDKDIQLELSVINDLDVAIESIRHTIL